MVNPLEKIKFVINVSTEVGEPLWLDFEHGVTEWKNDKDVTDLSGYTEEVVILVKLYQLRCIFP